jgi:hypothetical protein
MIFIPDIGLIYSLLSLESASINHVPGGKMKKMILTLLAFSSLNALATDLSWGGKDGTNEYPVVSMRTGAQTTIVRYMPLSSGEIKCSMFRKDLCKKSVKFIDIEMDNKGCSIQGQLVACLGVGLSIPKVTAILTDGTHQDIPEAATIFRIGTKTGLEFQDNGTANGTIVPVTRLTKQIEVWGDRADGLDPLVVSGQVGMFSDEDLQPVSASLLDINAGSAK